MIRVLAGEARGRRLKTPKGQQVRPTSAKCRAALFNVLGERLEGASFLDLFAGIGSVGIEALSRGARRVVFVERHPRVAALLRENLVACQLSGEWQILPRDVLEALTALQAQRERFDLIFLDPPYEMGWIERTLPLLSRPPLLLEPAGELIVQHSPREVPLPAYGPLQRRALKSYGDTQLSFLRSCREILPPTRQSR
ncbi:MAG: 16S rRNA (guanine(966)-N(2))-methyltransferase RsmD [Candidatus Tectomicrobia bacterium]|uniref:16S rRNA (Guanine(966)-N(2))-methyltransferase RsmD n=1 Tax=Tectimicrobiota bacterium TaxID=2528274 RepID=A0A932CNK2_UNCTE|nr:16S rRNA (guanine(966)-N(2))-methyltransferase RsmD [Candidatus Tectomicrobia bacterium]